jgi:RNA-directed DNA polymerase
MTSTPIRLYTRADVAELLDMPLRELTWWIWGLNEPRRYRQFLVSRRGSETPRVIDAPIKPIKDLQRRLADHLTEWYQPPPHVHGFVPGRSPVSNALLHRGKPWVLRVDLADFFPTIHFGRVRGMFMAYPFEYPADVATMLAQLCCHQRRLPQGAPTSPIVSNYLCRRLDTQLAHLARVERCHYSRYADDLVFSTNRRGFPSDLASIDDAGETEAGPAITEILTSNGFVVNAGKVRLMPYSQRQRVTGLVVNTKVNVPRSEIRALRGVLHIWASYGELDAAEALARDRPRPNWPPGKAAPDFRLVVRGRIQFVGSVRGWGDPVYQRLATKLAELDSTFHLRFGREIPGGPHRARLLTEGASDIDHLLAALAWLQARGEFRELELHAADYPNEGDEALLKHCEHIKDVPQTEPSVCLFDRDNDKVLRKVVNGGHFKHWGHGVVSLALVPPPDFEHADRFCIEMLYPASVLQREDAAGRRVYLADEFDRRSGRHQTGRSYTRDRGSSMVREEVFSAVDGESVAKGKTAFASAVLAREEPYRDVGFDSFRPTFEAIRQALAFALPRIADTRPAS